MSLHYKLPIPPRLFKDGKCSDKDLAKFYLLGSDKQNRDLFDAKLGEQTYILRIVGGQEPYFEWITTDGKAVGEVFDEIPADPQTELDRLATALAA